MDDLLNSLFQMCSGNVEAVKKGEEISLTLSNKPGYLVHLVQVMRNQPGNVQESLPLEVRMMAALILKNSVEKFWRRVYSSDVEQTAVLEEQTQIKSLLLCEAIMTESDSKIALFIGVIISKIAR